MDKTKFLLKLEAKLSILTEEERVKVLKKYASLIDEQVKAGKKEEEAIKELGDFDTLVKNVLRDYKIDSSYLNKENNSDNSFEGIINRFVNFIIDGIKHFAEKMQTKDFRTIFEITLYVLIALFAFWVLRLPFYIVEILGRSLFHVFYSPMSEVLGYGWSFTVNICYVLLIIWIIIVILNRLNHKTVIGEEKHTHRHKAEPVRETGEAALRHVPIDIISSLIKAFIVIIMLPFFFIQAGIVLIIGAIIALMIKGVIFIGPLLVAIGLLFILGSIIDLILYLTFNKGGRE